jgi:hypothetical protein
MAKINRQGDLKEEIKKKYNYTINSKRHEELVKKFRDVSTLSRYRTHLKIAVQEHAKFINQLPQETKDLITPPKDSKKAFLICRGGVWQPNLKFVTECVNASIKSGRTTTFEFFNSNVVLDKLEEKLKNRNKKK